MRIRRLALAAVLATAVVVPSVSVTAASAAPAVISVTKKPVKKKFTVDGTVTAVSDATITIRTRKVGSVTVQVGAGAVIRVNSAKKTLADLGTGFRVVVTGTRSGGDYIAVRVEAHGTKAAKPAKPVKPAKPGRPAKPTAKPSPSPTSDDPTGDDPAGDTPATDDPAGDSPATGDPAGDNPSAEPSESEHAPEPSETPDA